MQFTVNSSALASTLKRLTAVTATKNRTIPAFGTFKFSSTAEDSMSIYASSPDINTKANVSIANQGEHFAFCVSEELVTKAIQAFPKESSLAAVIEPGKLIVGTERSRFTFNTMDEGIFSPGKNFDGLPYVEFSLPAFLQKMKMVSFCQADGEVRPEYEVVCINKDHFVATDGIRLSYCKNDVLPMPPDVNILLKGGSVDRLIKIYDKLLDAEKPTGVFYATPTDVNIGGGGIFSSIRLAASKFPEYQRIIPRTNGQEIKANRKELISSLERLLIIFSKRALTFAGLTFSGPSLTIAAKDDTNGEVVERIDVKGEAFGEEILVNPTFLLEALKVYDVGEITFGLIKDQFPLILTDGDHVHVLQRIARPG